MSYDPNKPLIFQHIPKCAGTSVLTIFRDWFGERLLLHYFDRKENRLPEKHLLTEPAPGVPSVCLFGHFNRTAGFGVEEYYPSVDQQITIIRDPLEYRISGYFFAMKRFQAGHPNPLGKEIVTKSIGIGDYLSEYPCDFTSFLPADLTPENYPSLLREKYLFIGLTEQLDESIASIASILGKPPRRAPRKNQTARNSNDLPQGARESFLNANAFAYEVYGECIRIFEERRVRGARKFFNTLKTAFHRDGPSDRAAGGPRRSGK